jgi:hypothetical protein
LYISIRKKIVLLFNISTFKFSQFVISVHQIGQHLTKFVTKWQKLTFFIPPKSGWRVFRKSNSWSVRKEVKIIEKEDWVSNEKYNLKLFVYKYVIYVRFPNSKKSQLAHYFILWFTLVPILKSQMIADTFMRVYF